MNKELLDRFKNLYKKKYDINLTDEDATKMVGDLLNLMRVLTKPLPRKTNNETYIKGDK